MFLPCPLGKWQLKQSANTFPGQRLPQKQGPHVQLGPRSRWGCPSLSSSSSSVQRVLRDVTVGRDEAVHCRGQRGWLPNENPKPGAEHSATIDSTKIKNEASSLKEMQIFRKLNASAHIIRAKETSPRHHCTLLTINSQCWSISNHISRVVIMKSSWIISFKPTSRHRATLGGLYGLNICSRMRWLRVRIPAE